MKTNEIEMNVCDELELNNATEIDETEFEEIEDDEYILDEILDEVVNWFWNNCNENGYDNSRDRYRDLSAMADHANDMMVDHCIDRLDLSEEEVDKFYEDIENKLAELASEEI